MEDNDQARITITTYDDEIIDCLLLDVKRTNNKSYAALLNPNDQTILIYRYHEKDGDIDLQAITNEEFKHVKPLFDRYIKDNPIDPTLKKPDLKDCDQLLERFDLGHFKHSSQIHPKLAIQLVSTWDKEKAKMKRSRIGGKPNVPADFAWPESNNQPLDFLVQINCSELPKDIEETYLPDKGMLYFFYDCEYLPTYSEGGVIYQEDITTLKPYSKHKSKYKPVYQRFITRCSFPDASQVHFSRNPENGEYYDDEENYYEMTEWMNGDTQMFGHPKWVQDNPLNDLEHYLNDPKFNADDWVLLLQLDSVIEANMNWIDWGKLYFFILKTDLHKQQFDKVKVILQHS